LRQGLGFAGDGQYLGQLLAFVDQQAIALGDPAGRRQCSATAWHSDMMRTPNSSCSTVAASSPFG
jgi:hypothetical protein